MIKLFRKIRQKLLSENKFSKYLIYAIGEIILVVIGILIALQINNWNTLKNNSIEAEVIKKSLIVDLKKDSIQLKSSIAKISKDVKQISNLIDRFQSKEASFDTLVAIAQDFYPFHSGHNTYNNATFESIINTGKLSLLNEMTRVLLLEHNSNQIESLRDITLGLYSAKLSHYTSNYYYGKPLDNFVSRMYWTIDNKRNFTIEFTTLCLLRRHMLKEQLASNQKVLDKTMQLIKVLNSSNDLFIDK